MTELSKAAQGKLDRHIALVERNLRKSGRDSAEITFAVDSLREQVFAMLASGTDGTMLIDEAKLENALDTLDPPQDWDHEGVRQSENGLALGALGCALLTVLGMVIAGIFADANQMDGGAALSTVGLFGFSATLILGLMSRTNKLGRAALYISGSVMALFILALIIEVFGI